MTDSTPSNLLAIPLAIDSPEFAAVCDWPFRDDYVRRVLRNNIPQRVYRGAGQVWIYVNSEREIIGFGTIDICLDYGDFTQGQPHPYIPLLAVNPAHLGRGYGSHIVRHLIQLATNLADTVEGFHDVLYLDVYTDNDVAIKLYGKCGFRVVSSAPRTDPDEDDRPYLIMAIRVSASPVGDRDR